MAQICIVKRGEEVLAEMIWFGCTPSVFKNQIHSLVKTKAVLDMIVESVLYSTGLIVTITEIVEKWWTEPSMNTTYAV